MNLTRKYTALVSGLLCIMYVVDAAQAGETAVDVDQLSALLKRATSISGSFEQLTVTSDGVEQGRNSGHFRLLQPDYFYWEITRPDHQIFVSDSRHLTHYDVDLEQATVSSADAIAGFTPAEILTGGASQLTERFRVQLLEEGCNAELCYQLVPAVADSNFDHLTLGFNGSDLELLSITDSFKQQTVITLLIDHAAAAPLASDFLLEFPEDVDIIHNE